MQGHGEDDDIIKLEWARRAAEVLGPRCESLEFKTYKDVGHTVSDLQVNTVTLTPAIGNNKVIITFTSTSEVSLSISTLQGDPSGQLQSPVDLVPTVLAAAGPLL